MILSLLACLPILLAQEAQLVPASPFDQVVELELTTDDEVLIDEHGPTVVFEYGVEFEGTLHIWTRSQLDLFLRVEDTVEFKLLNEDEDSGGGRTPYLRLEVSKGDVLAVFVAGPKEATGPLELHLVAAPETAATREAAAAAGKAQIEAARLRGEGDNAAARELLKETIEELGDTTDSQYCQAIADALLSIGTAAGIAQDIDSIFECRSRARAFRERTLPADHPDLLSAQHSLADSMHVMGDLPGARALREAVLEACERTLPADHPALLRARANLAVSMQVMGDLPGARALREAVLEAYESTLPADHRELLVAQNNLAGSMHAMGDLPGARALWEAVLEARERTLPADHPDLLSAQHNLAVSMQAMGDLPGARALREAVLEAYERTLPADHPDLLMAQSNLAVSMHAMGDLPGARALFEAVLEAYERTLPADHPDLLGAQNNLAISMEAMGDLPGARALKEAVLEASERTLPADHPKLLGARTSLAISMHAMGDLPGARALREAVLEARERTLPADHRDLLGAQNNLAISMGAMGDLPGARALKEAVLEALERTLPADHPDLLGARASLASSMHAMGDLPGARALQEAVLEAYERTLPADHPSLLGARTSLASSMDAMGDLPGARALREAVLEAYERTLPADHPSLLSAQHNLANSMQAMGDLAGARVLREAVLEARERTFPADHPDLLRAQLCLALSMQAMGDLPGARALQEAVLEAYERTLPADHPDLLRAQSYLANTMQAMGDLPGARALLPELCAGMRARILASLTLAPRQARQTVGSEGGRLSSVYFLSAAAESSLQSIIFELTETMRMVAGEAARSLAEVDGDPELAPILEQADEVRRKLNDLIAGMARGEADRDAISAEVARLSFERDRLEGEASRRLAQRGVVMQPVETKALVSALGPQDALVGYRRLRHRTKNEESGLSEAGVDHLLAHVLGADGALTRVDLGPAEELEHLASAWRAALGAPLLRGVAVEQDEKNAEASAGSRLRERILDPVLAACGDDVQRLFVCADDLVFLLPLDALPLDDEGTERLGDRVRILSEVSFARLLSGKRSTSGEPSLLAVGGVDYDAAGEAPRGLVAASAPIEDEDDPPAAGESLDPDASDASGGRSSVPSKFKRLNQSRREVQETADLFEETFEGIEPVLLLREETTKAALFAAAPGKRFVHIATHGWFAPESVRSTEDAAPQRDSFARMGIEQRVSGLAPMTLCGLALAGANRGRDSLGRVMGILTAEELCSLDLSQCELAVLSACETNVGIRRAGQGIQSLQAALYAAGARTSITSLWKVDDAATRSLMEAFYTNLWLEGMGKAEALWEAKKALREDGDPPAHWAAWVLTGDPD